MGGYLKVFSFSFFSTGVVVDHRLNERMWWYGWYIQKGVRENKMRHVGVTYGVQSGDLQLSVFTF
jgi:hypothetical protein